MKHKFLVHNSGDHVGVAVENIAEGDAVYGVVLADNSQTETIIARTAIPLGHKIALADVAANDAVIEYSLQIGVSSMPIRVGDYVHTHNLKTARWS